MLFLFKRGLVFFGFFCSCFCLFVFILFGFVFLRREERRGCVSVCMGRGGWFFSLRISDFLKECSRLLLCLVILTARQLFPELKRMQIRQGQGNQKQISALV